MKKSRKSQIIGIAFGVILLAVCIAFANTGSAERKSGKPAKYIFLFIGDGMGATHVAATESYQAYLDGELGFKQVSFTEFPVLGMAETFSADKSITCSSASGTAISCGAKTLNGRLGITPEGDTLTSVAKILSDRGYKVAVMSSVPVNHATPAAFYGHNVSRHDYYGITCEIPKSGYEFFAGSGFVDFYGKDGNGKDSKTLLEENGYTVCFGEEEYEKAVEAGADKIVLCQERSRMVNAPTYISGDAQAKDIPSEEVIKKCLDFLGDKSPFFIMYEQGEIDWAAHSNETMPMVAAVQKLDNAVKAALEFYNEHPDETLIIVTADHETGGIVLGADGAGNGDSEIIGWEILDKAWKDSGHTNTLSVQENKALNDSAFIGWTTSGHSGGPVPVYAIGKGSERFGGRYDNTDIKGKILAE